MELTYYPGCTLTGSAKELDESFRAAATRLGVTLKELPDWTCCGASSAHMVDAYLEAALPAKDLMTAERIGRDVVAPCAGCHVRMKASAMKIQEDKELKSRYNLKGDIDIISGTEFFAKPELLAALKERISKPLTDLKVVPYYGCLAVRPLEVVEPEDPENPTQMDKVLDALGAQVLSWPYKTDCCGGSLALTHTDSVLKLCGKLIDMAKKVGADAIVTLCPMCQANLDTRQDDMTKALGKKYDMPILFLTELMGVAFGHPKARSWFEKHLISPINMLASKKLL